MSNVAAELAWIGLGADHLYPRCPSRVRSEASLRAFGWWSDDPLNGTVDPHGTDVCGLCVARYNRQANR